MRYPPGMQKHWAAGLFFASLFTLALIANASAGPARTDAAIIARSERFFAGEASYGKVTFGALAVRDSYAVLRFFGPVEDSRVQGALVLQHYAFGWQIVDLTFNRLRTCDVRFAVPTGELRALLRPTNELQPSKEPCATASAVRRVPAGEDETAIRRSMLSVSNEAINSVAIADGYALVGFYGNGGGQAVFAKRAGTWRRIGMGGGAIDAAGLVGDGVPRVTANRLLHDVNR